jgi:DNA-binding MarR family transcriptional regulator
MSYEHIGKYISIAKRFQSAKLDKMMKKLEISSGQIFLVHILSEKEGISQQELCDFYQIDKAAVGRSLKKLEQVGIIIKKVDNEDKRYNKLFLTEKWKKLLPAFREILDSFENEIRQDLTKAEVDFFLRIIKKICINLGAKL